MKRLVFTSILTITFVAMLSSQTQTEFIIGADWLNNPTTESVPSPSDWTHMKDLGLTWGHIILCKEQSCREDAFSVLNSASQNGMKVILYRRNLSDPANGQRWQYHPEYQLQYLPSERTGVAVEDGDAVRFPDDWQDANDSWKAIVGTHQPGYVAQGLQSPFNIDQPDGMTYFVKLHMRLDPGTPLTHTAVVTVSVVRGDGTQVDSTVYADQFGSGYNYGYTDVLALSFTKTTSGPLSAPNQQAYQQSLLHRPEENTIGPMGLPLTSAQTPPVSLDYRVYWPGNVNCYLDYIVVDDGTANDLFGGSSDSLIDQEVNLFKTYSGLGRFQIVDEVPFQHYGSYLCVGRVDQRIKSNVIASGYPTKTGFHWNNSYWSQQQQLVQRDIAWTQSNQSASDIYPIYAGVSLPYDPMYTTNFQSQIQNNLINYLLMNITAANLFNVPFWFTPQVDSWPHDFREPTVTELRQMVNLGLAYGAKGIDYFLYWSAIDTGGTAEGLVETDGSPRGIIYGGTSYAGNKWETVKSINQQLSLLGPTLVGLRWQNAFSIHNGPPTETYISNVSTDADAANLTYVELGLFTDAPANRYFMLVNRRTLNGESRNITAAFSLPITSGNTWEVSDVVSGNLWVVPYNGSFTDSLNPGSAKLYKVTPSTATWSGTKTLANNVTVSIGATLTILPGTSVLLPTGSSITINGTLTSVGTISQPITFDRTGTSGTYYGLALQPGSTGTFSYCKFNNAYVGVTCYSSNVSINNSTFTNCTGGVTVSGASPTINGCVFLSNYFGVYLVNSNPSIVNCDIENSANSGMYLSNAAPTIQYNTLKNNQQSGIWFHNFSSPSNIYHNNISGSSEGFYCDGQSSPHALYGCNAMNSGYTQIYAYYGCLPVLGNANSSGLNSFDGSPYTYVNANSSSVVTAVYNWWGISSPNPSLFYSDATSSVVWSPSLNYDPNPGRPKVDIQSPTPTAGPFADSTFNLAYQTYQAGRYSDAISLCLKVYLANTSAPSMAKMALLFLADAYERSGQTDFLTYLTSNITAKATLIPDLALVERELQAHWLVKGGRYSDAIATYKGITTDFAGNPDASKFALFNMGETYNFYLNDPVHAKIALQQFKSKYPSDRLATVANFILSGSAGVPAPSKQNAGGSNGSPNTTPTGFALESNYPNPFNPSTQISYLLPEAGNVSLVIYDVLGREVANLADGYQQAGRYTVTWNSTRTSGIPVASGVYFARLRILNDLGTVKFAKTTRLLLMK